MAANKKLTKLFTEIADSIREVKDIVRPLTPSEFPEAIKSMDKRPVVERDINFYDYEGTLLYSYDVSEIKNLKELPPLPYHEGLICQGWNWDYEDVIALDYPMNIGAMYITDDGKTRIHICIETMEYSTIPIHLYQSVSNGISIDWGDGSPIETLEGINGVSGSHKYSQVGEYVVTLEPLEECDMGLGRNGSEGVFGNQSTSSTSTVWKNCIARKAFIGKNYTYYNVYGFGYSAMLEEITCPSYWTKMPCTFSTSQLKFLTIPKYVKEFSNYSFYAMYYSKGTISIPNGVLTIPGNCFAGGYELKSLTLPDSVTSIQGLNDLRCLTKFRIPKNTIIIGQNCFNGCSQIKEINFPKSLKVIKSGALQGVRASIIDIPNVQELSNSAFRGNVAIKMILPKKVEVNIMGQYFMSGGRLRKVVLPENLATIDSYAMSSQYYLYELYLPSTLQSIGVQAFANNWSCKFYDFTACNQVPVLSNTNAFQALRTDCEIRVPEDLYDEWVAATNWATYADYIKAYPRTEYDYDALMEKYYGNEFNND